LKKADEWRRLLTVTPVILWFAWRDQLDNIPDTEPEVSPNESITTAHSRKRKTLYDIILLLCAGVRLLSTKNITMSQARAGQTYLANYCQRLLLLGVKLTVNHHLAMHFASMIKLYGPVYSWWLFAFERFNGMLEKVKHNGHDGGRMELTLMRNWVQTHLIYEFLLAMPPDASPHERRLLERLIKTEAAQERGAMMTQLAIFRSEATVNSVSLPKVLPKPVNLHNIHPESLAGHHSDLYTILLQHCQQTWPDLQLQREFSQEPGSVFLGHQVARRLPYIRKDGLRYGSVGNRRTTADTFAYIQRDNVRCPIRIEELFVIQVPGTNKPPHVCAIIRRLYSDNGLPTLPWDLL